MPIRTKMHVVNVSLAAVVLLAASLNILVQNGETKDLGQGFSDLSACESVQTCLAAEKTAFQNYLRARSSQNRQGYERACAASQEALSLLPYDAHRISLERFARTRNLRNAYASYEKARDAVAVLDLDQNGSIRELYEVYDRQNALLSDTSSLISLTVEDNVKIGLHNRVDCGMWSGIFRMPRYWLSEKEFHDRALELLDVFNMADNANDIAGSLPYGAQRRLEIVRALATGPKLLLLDEPAAGMNPVETEELMENIVKIRDDFQIAVLLIEHDMDLVMGICEGIVVLNFGKVIAKGTPEEIQANPQVVEAYLGKQD